MTLDINRWLGSPHNVVISGLMYYHATGAMVLDPPYQRGSVWTQDQQRAWIESILEGLPLPAMFLNETPGVEQMVMIDGRQRMEAMLAFRADAFRVRGELWSEQTSTFHRVFDRTGMPVVYTRFETERQCAELYIRLLVTGTAHTADEIAKAQAMLEDYYQ